MKFNKWVAASIICFSSLFCFAASTDYRVNDDGTVYSYDLITKSPWVDVRAHGAKGDGVTDDTAAIKKAFAAASAAAIGYTPRLGYVASAGTTPVVVFPKGHYLISDTIHPNPYCKIVSDSHAIIRQTVNTKDIFDFSTHNGYIISVRGLSLIGGKSQIIYGNTNLGGASLLVRECDFVNNKGAPAIKFVTTGRATNLSCLAIVEDSKFDSVYQAVETAPGVEFNLRKSWVCLNNSGLGSPPDMMDGAVFVNRHLMLFDEMYSSPPPEGAPKGGRWVDNYGTFIARNSRFGGEGGGLPIVFNYAGQNNVYPYVSGNGIIIKDSVVCMGINTNPNQSIVKFMTDVPQHITLRDNLYGVHGGTLIKVDSGLDLDTYVNALSANVRIYIDIENNQIFPAAQEGATIPSALLNHPDKVIFNSKFLGAGSKDNPAMSFYGNHRLGFFKVADHWLGMASEQEMSGSFSEIVTLGDDRVYTVPSANSPVGGILMIVRAVDHSNGIFGYRRTGGAESLTTLAIGGDISNQGTNDLTDRTGDGTDGKLNVSVNGDLIHVKNRLGTSINFRVFIFGMSS